MNDAHVFKQSHAISHPVNRSLIGVIVRKGGSTLREIEAHSGISFQQLQCHIDELICEGLIALHGDQTYRADQGAVRRAFERFWIPATQKKNHVVGIERVFLAPTKTLADGDFKATRQ